MTIRWTESANADFSGIIAFLKARNPAAAVHVGRRILDAVEALSVHPCRGRPGRSPDTRELVIANLPYLVIYAIEKDIAESDPARIAVLRVLHGAMLWPPEE